MSIYAFIHIVCAILAMSAAIRKSGGIAVNLVVAIVCLLLGPAAVATCALGRLAAFNDRPVAKDGSRK